MSLQLSAPEEVINAEIRSKNDDANLEVDILGNDALVIVTGDRDNAATSLHLPAAAASFGAKLGESTPACIESLLQLDNEWGRDGGEGMELDETSDLSAGVEAWEQAEQSDGPLVSSHVAHRSLASRPVSLLDHWRLQLKAGLQCQPLDRMPRIAPRAGGGSRQYASAACSGFVASGRLILVDRDVDGTFEGCDDGIVDDEEDEDDEYLDPEDETHEKQAERYNGAVVVVARGTCTFVHKTMAAQVSSRGGGGSARFKSASQGKA